MTEIQNKVYLIGAGPGDEGLITVKGLKYIQEADVIVYDNLVNEKILNYSKKQAKKIYVGKKANQHALPQEKINELLVEEAKTNRIVVRLKGGDPFVFGRGGEEALELKKNNILFDIIPGISSSIAAPAYSGIPVSHRAVSTSFHVITGHEDPTKESEQVDYETLSRLNGTLIFLMGLNNIVKITSELIKHGKPKNTPAAVISKGTTPSQKVAVGTLENIAQKLENITYPAIIMVGEVINLREHLNWFEEKPLFSRKILVTRARHQASLLSQQIEAAGGQAIEFPTIETVPGDNHEELKLMFEKLTDYDWIIFTSVNGVEVFFDKFFSIGYDIRQVGNAKICTIGEATKKAIEKFYLNVEFMPEEYIAEALIKGLKELIKPSDKILIPRAEVAREILPDQLREFSSKVDVVSLYKTIIPEYNLEELIEILKIVDTITFTSSSTVSNFVQILGKDNLHLLDDKNIACIGPVTSNTASKFGINVTKIAHDYTIEGLIKILSEE